MRLVAVAVPVPFLDLLTYGVPDRLDLPPIGARVRVPIGTRILTGCVVSHDAPAVGEVREVAEVLDPEPYVPAGVVELCRWVADYYVAGIGDALALAMPPGARAKASGFRTRRVAHLTVQGMAALDGRLTPVSTPEDDALNEVRTDRGAGSGRSGLTASQRAAIEALGSGTAGVPLSDLRDRGVSAAVLGRLAAKGLVVIRAEADERDPFERASMANVTPDAGRRLTGEQQEAFERLSALAGERAFRVALLRGVTGSGKTEIYLRLAAKVCAQDRRVLLLVPEIALTPSLAALVRGAFGSRVAIQHSALSTGERHDQWQRIRRGDVDLVIGTRSAVFAPIERLGLVIVDEEHDASYKQDETPRYHGRDVAIVRARADGALVVLGSATPSMETYQHAATGKYATATLERRVLDRPLPAVRVVNMRDEYADGGPDVVLSRALVASIEHRLARREQVLVLLNRRGYATAVFCRQCGDSFDCPNCSISLTVHRARGGWSARCHYCNHAVRVPVQCRKCAAPYLEQSGFGTEKVEQQLHERFPEARIGRVDRDSIRRKGALTEILTRFGAGELDIIVGTQMIAKGHDFPNVTLVGVISADVGLGMADFRAAERTFQLLTQVAGRAGRGEREGEAIVQTLYPDHYSIQLACTQDYPAFFEKEIAYRRAMRYPPLVALVNVVVRGRTFDEAMGIAAAVAGRLAPAAASTPFTLLGPAPAALERLRGEHRVQLLLKGTRRGGMRQALRDALAQMPEARRRVTIDVDPLSVL